MMALSGPRQPLRRQDGVALDDRWFTRFQGKVQGPFSVEELHVRAKRGRFTRLHEVSQDGMAWSRASQYPELFPTTSSSRKPPPQPQPEAVPQEQPNGPAEEPADYRVAEPAVDAAIVPSWQPSDADSPMPQSAGDANQEWYYTQGPDELGPVSFAALQTLVSGGQLSPQEHVWREGMPGWVQVQQFPGLMPSPVPAADRPAFGSLIPAEMPKLAIASFALGVAGASILFFLGSIGAVVLGHVALGHIGNIQPQPGGRPWAIAGLVLGYVVLIGAPLICIVLLIVRLFSGGAPAPG